MSGLFLFPIPEPIPETAPLDTVLSLPVLDYRAYRIIYETSDSERALATILRDHAGGLLVRRILPGRVERSADLRNALEVAIFLDLESIASPWSRDTDEEEWYRKVARNGLEV